MAILLLLTAAAAGSGVLMVALFQQSATAQTGEAEAMVGRACDAIASAYRFYTSGWQRPQASTDDAALRRDLPAVLLTALQDRTGIEGGVWDAQAGSLAYAFPTYEGSGPKTDFPAAEFARIQAINRAALAEDRPVSSRVDTASQTLLVAACPLSGPIAGLSAWTMTRVHAFAGRNYWQLMAGLILLFATVVAACALSASLILTWSRHVGWIEAALNAHDIAELPALQITGERELDRIVVALNEAGRRLEASRQRSEDLSRRVADNERLAAIGRLAAGIAHEIRNPIAAMRLKAETALEGTSARKDQALTVVLAQVDRLDRLVRRLLTVTEREPPHIASTSLAALLSACAEAHADVAAARGVAILAEGSAGFASLDAEQMRSALDNLVLNAIEVAPAGSTIRVSAERTGESLVLAVSDAGAGPPEDIRHHLFEPFVTGRPDGTGLGLSIVREIAEAHGGTAGFEVSSGRTVFKIEVPWRSS